MRRIIAASIIALLAALGSSNAWAETVYSCPDLNQAEEVGTCPSKDDVMAQQKRLCAMERDQDTRKLMACDDFPAFFERKATSLWAIQMGGEEQLTYRPCTLGAKKIENGKPLKMRVRAPDRFSWLFCSYANKETISIKVDKNCKLKNGEKAMDCGPDGAACTAVCE